MNRTKMLIVGWDGATFDIIKPLVDKGKLPNIATLMRNGVWGRLDSTIPPLTPVAWTSMSTGVNPGKHGIYDAMIYNQENHKVSFVNATLRKVKPIWSILSERNKNVGVINVPMTYPPDEVNGFVISGMFTPDGVADFMYPAELKAEIEDKFGKYIIECRQIDDPSAYLKIIIEMVDYREKITLYLIERQLWDFFFVVFMASDRVQHFYWKYLDPLHPEHDKYGDAIAIIYERLDKSLGKILQKVGSNVNIMMVSDHGSGQLNSAFFLNNWLIKNGYLFLKEDVAKVLKIKRPSFLRRTASSIKRLLPSVVQEKIKLGSPNRQEELNIFASLIDWEKTIAFSEGVSGGIYINDTIDPEKYQKILDKIRKDLCSIKDPSGKNVIKNVYSRNEIYKGNYITKAPDLTIVCDYGYQIIAPNEFLFFNKKYEDAFFLSHKWSGRHEQYGIFILSGPVVKKNVEITNARILDITPTVLYLMNEPIPDYMDGKVLEKTILKEYFIEHPVNFNTDSIEQEKPDKALTEEEEKEIAERLKSLGYIE